MPIVRWFGWVTAAIIAVSIAVPTGVPWLGAIAVGVLLYGILQSLLQNPRGRPPLHAIGRFSRRRPLTLPTNFAEILLAAVALWEVLWWLAPSLPLHQAMLAAVVVGVILALAKGAIRDTFYATLAVPAVIVVARRLIRGDECVESVGFVTPHAAILLAGIAAGVAILVWLGYRAVLARVGLGTSLLGLVGLVELVEFTVAPTGVPILEDAPDGILIAAAGFMLIIVIGLVINPDGVSALVAVAMAMAILGLTVYALFLGLDDGTCGRYGAQLLTYVAALAGALGGGLVRT